MSENSDGLKSKHKSVLKNVTKGEMLPGTDLLKMPTRYLLAVKVFQMGAVEAR